MQGGHRERAHVIDAQGRRPKAERAARSSPPRGIRYETAAAADSPAYRAARRSYSPRAMRGAGPSARWLPDPLVAQKLMGGREGA
jgi:hypothetical protein